VIANECAFYSGFAFFDSFLRSKIDTSWHK